MSKLLRRVHNDASFISNKCLFLEAPLEIRLTIYAYIAPDCFFLYASYRDYMGLLLSCKQLRDEMEQESLQASTRLLQELQDREEDAPIKLSPLRPLTFSSLLHLTISVPRWALLSLEIQDAIFETLVPVLNLHLSSLTIGIEDVQSYAESLAMHASLDAMQSYLFMAAHDFVHEGQNEDNTGFYDIRTTYTSIIGFVTRINCLVAPDLCHGKHDAQNHWCNGAVTFVPTTYTTRNVRRVTFCLKKLHDEYRCGCGRLPHYVYPHNSCLLRWCPTYETRWLRRSGWRIRCYSDKGRIMLRGDPSVFSWKKLEEKKSSRLIKGLKALLNHQ